MSRLRTTTALLLLATPLCAASANAQDVGKDVPPTHWAYQAVQDLASKGLIKGYPPDGNFLGGRTLTRYEMATIIQRVVARMDDLVKTAGGPQTGVSKDDFDALQTRVGEIANLVDQFKTQLAVLGTDLDTVKSDLATLKGQVADLATRVDGYDAKLGDLSKKVDQASVLADQALTNIDELKTATNAALAKKVDLSPGVGKLRLSGLLQVWYANPMGRTLNGASPSNFSSAASTARSFGGGVGDTFRLRRGEIALIGQIVPQVDFRVMFDVAKTSNTTAQGSPLQDLWIGYQLNKRVRIEVGQQKTGLSEEGTRSSSALLTVERSIMNGLPGTITGNAAAPSYTYQMGRVGDIRDTGAVARYSGAKGNAMLGIWNGNGNEQNKVSDQRQKFATVNAYFTGVRHATLGVWGGTLVGDFKPRNVQDRAGATLILQSGANFFESEFAYTRDAIGGNPAVSGNVINTNVVQAKGMGGYALAAHSLSRKWQLVARYDEWDPAIHGTGGGVFPTVGSAFHNLREYTAGVNYYIRSANAKIQFNYIIDDVPHSGNAQAFWGIRRQIALTNFQVAF